MGSSLGHTLANIFIGQLEYEMNSSCKYVDVCFIITDGEKVSS